MVYTVNFSIGKLVCVASQNKNNLAVGTVLHLNGYTDPDYVILANSGVSAHALAYGAEYRCLDLTDGVERIIRAYELKWLFQKKDNRIQMYITDKVLAGAALETACNAARQARTEIEAENQRKADALKKEIESLPARYPYLTPGTDAQIAKNLRAELKHEFPKVKFSVRKQSYSSYAVSWSDGPAAPAVDKVLQKFESGYFDGMNDIYEYVKTAFTSVFGGAQYIFTARTTSKGLLIAAAKSLGYTLVESDIDQYNDISGFDFETKRRIYHALHEMSV